MSTDETITEAITGGTEAANRRRQQREAAARRYPSAGRALAGALDPDNRQHAARARTSGKQRKQRKQAADAATNEQDAASGVSTYQAALAAWLHDPDVWSDPADRWRLPVRDDDGNLVPAPPRKQRLFTTPGGYRHAADTATVRTMHLAGQPGHNKAWKETLLAERASDWQRTMAQPAAGSMQTVADPALPPSERAAVTNEITLQRGMNLGDWIAAAPRTRQAQATNQKLLRAGLTTTPVPEVAGPSV